MARGRKKATGCSKSVILLIAVIGLVRMFATRREAPPAQPFVPAPSVQAPRPPVPNVPPPVVSATASYRETSQGIRTGRP